MSVPTTAAETPAAPDRKRRRPRKVPLWVIIVGVAIASPAITFGVFSLGNYIENTTTVTVTLISWAIVLHGQDFHEYTVSCQTQLVNGVPTGQDTCPYRVHPGSDYNTTFFVSGYFQNTSLTLGTPSPFELVSTTPSLPVMIPSNGLELTVELKLPTSAGQYNFTGTESFS